MKKAWHCRCPSIACTLSHRQSHALQMSSSPIQVRHSYDNDLNHSKHVKHMPNFRRTTKYALPWRLGHAHVYSHSTAMLDVKCVFLVYREIIQKKKSPSPEVANFIKTYTLPFQIMEYQVQVLVHIFQTVAYFIHCDILAITGVWWSVYSHTCFYMHYI